MSLLKIKNCLFKVMLELFVLNKAKKSIIKSRWAKKNLKKYVDFGYKNVSFEPTKKVSGENEVIFQYWQQGYDNAPLLIKKCLESTKKYNPDKKIIFLDFPKIKDYIEIPSRYYDLFKKGKIKSAHFSDVVRTYLLSQYGGLWVDSTIYFTGKIPDNIFNSDFFVFSKDEKTDWLENNMSNYFIRSKAQNRMINSIKSALDYYWLENNFVINYFMYEHMVTMLSKKEGLKEDWAKMPYYSAFDTGVLLSVMNKDYDDKTFNEIKSKTNIHKLSYKRILPKTSGKSYYDKIIREEI